MCHFHQSLKACDLALYRISKDYFLLGFSWYFLLKSVYSQSLIFKPLFTNLTAVRLFSIDIFIFSFWDCIIKIPLHNISLELGHKLIVPIVY